MKDISNVYITVAYDAEDNGAPFIGAYSSEMAAKAAAFEQTDNFTTVYVIETLLDGHLDEEFDYDDVTRVLA